jgi:Zn-dependent peptidase ImmA (M78 family)/transcriptional regulator with XRE-family HTH domain
VATTDQAYITPAIISWARGRIGLPKDRLAKKLGVKPQSLASWEEGEAAPTLRQAERLAKVLYIPFGYLFLKDPPKEQEVPLPDFRTLRDAEFKRPSAEFSDLLDDVLAKHEWYREHLQQEGRISLSFVGRFRNAGESPYVVARDIGKTLQIDAGLRESCSTWEDFLRLIIERAEGVGILVMRSGVVAGNPHRSVSPKEFRGFTICDQLAPLVYINGADWKAAQIFTLAHELSHVWIGETGISNEDLSTKEEPNATEHFCNAVAAEVLVPEKDFVSRWTESDSLDSNVQRLRRYYRVSSLVVLRRAFTVKFISWRSYQEIYYREEESFKEKREHQAGGGNYWFNFFNRNSHTFTSAIVEAALEGRVLYRDAADLLNVKVSAIPKIAEKLG